MSAFGLLNPDQSATAVPKHRMGIISTPSYPEINHDSETYL
jgi:hypothetical protein